MDDFNFIIPLQKGANDTLTGIASTTSVDRDDEKMSDDALRTMVDSIRKQGVNLFGNHEHNWENTLGAVKSAELINNQVQVGITLDDPRTNPKVPMLLNKLARGIKLGLSVGGNVGGFRWEFDKTKNKKIKVLDKVQLYEISVVGIPSNADSLLSIPNAIAKSAKPRALNCPCCFSELRKSACPTCFWKSDAKPHFISEPFGLPRELQPAGKFREEKDIDGKCPKCGSEGEHDTCSNCGHAVKRIDPLRTCNSCDREIKAGEKIYAGGYCEECHRSRV